MRRKRPEINLNQISIMLIEEYQLQTVKDIQNVIKGILGGLLENMLKAELNGHLDYEYGQTPLSLNTRNRSSKKKVKSSSGENIIGYSKG